MRAEDLSSATQAEEPTCSRGPLMAAIVAQVTGQRPRSWSLANHGGDVGQLEDIIRATAGLDVRECRESCRLHVEIGACAQARGVVDGQWRASNVGAASRSFHDVLF